MGKHEGFHRLRRCKLLHCEEASETKKAASLGGCTYMQRASSSFLARYPLAFYSQVGTVLCEILALYFIYIYYYYVLPSSHFIDVGNLDFLVYFVINRKIMMAVARISLVLGGGVRPDSTLQMVDVVLLVGGQVNTAGDPYLVGESFLSKCGRDPLVCRSLSLQLVA